MDFLLVGLPLEISASVGLSWPPSGLNQRLIETLLEWVPFETLHFAPVVVSVNRIKVRDNQCSEFEKVYEVIEEMGE